MALNKCNYVLVFMLYVGKSLPHLSVHLFACISIYLSAI